MRRKGWSPWISGIFGVDSLSLMGHNRERLRQRTQRAIMDLKLIIRKVRGRQRIWRYGIADIAEWIGMSQPTVLRDMHLKRFVPNDLASVRDYVKKRTSLKWGEKEKT